MKFHLSARKKEVFLTISSNLLLQFVNAICGFILPPLIINTFGSSVNGMVSSISQFIAYLNIVEAGVGGAAIAALYKPLALEDTDERNAILSATSKFYNRSGILFTTLILILSLIYPFIVGTQVDRMQSSLMVLVLGITGAAEFFLIGKYRVLLTADKKVYVISLVQMGALIVSTSLAVILIKTGFGIILVKLGAALVFLARYLILSLFVKLHYKKISFRTVPDTKAINQSKNVLIHQIGSLIVFNSPLVIITIFCSLKDASVYTVYAMVFNAVNQLLGAFSNGMQSFFGESLVTDSTDRTRNIYSRYELVYFAIEGWFYAMTYLLIMPFIQIYTKNITDAEYIQPLLATLFVLVGILNAIRNPSSQLISAAGHFKKTQWRCILEAFINVVCSVAGVLIFGFKGVLFGAICSGLYRGIDMILYSSNHILNSIKAGFLTLLEIFIFGFIYYICCRLLQLISFIPQNYLQWIILAVIYGLLLSVPLSIIFLFKKLLTHHIKNNT